MLTVAFLYNVRHQYPDPTHPLTQLEADFDDPITIKCIIRHLKNCGYRVIPIEANEKAFFKLYRTRKKIDMVLNYAEGTFGLDREAQLPAILEMLQIPYTGSSPLTQALGLNKAKTKEILIANNLPTLPFQVFKTGSEKISKKLNFPLIAKPLSEGSGAGIDNKSVVFNETSLRKKIKQEISFFKEPVLVEPFLDGKEYSVAMIGNPPKIMPLVSPDHSQLPKGFLPMDSLEVKWIFEEETNNNYLQCPAKLDSKLKNKVHKICFGLWKALEVRDLCRIDIRCDRKNNPYILEFNSPPGIIPPEVSTTSYFPLACRKAGIDYEEMLKTIINSALKRYKT
jgi:D-alanine-D-alanine ligase